MERLSEKPLQTDGRPEMRWATGEREPLTFEGAPKIMGVLNLTPDSFYDGGRLNDVGRAVEYAERMADEGADLIDVGGESTRPGASPVSAREEAARVVPVIRKLAHRLGPQTVISVDTYKAAVARRAVEAGVGVINDVSAGAMDREMFETVAELGVGYVIMHMRGEPRSMQMDTEYRDMMAEIYEFFESSLERARAAGIEREKIVLDPGIGFGKSAFANYRLISGLSEFAPLGRPLLVGPSRKSFLALAGLKEPDDRLEGTLAAATVATLAGAHILRVHDVGPVRRAVRVASFFPPPSRLEG